MAFDVRRLYILKFDKIYYRSNFIIQDNASPPAPSSQNSGRSIPPFTNVSELRIKSDKRLEFWLTTPFCHYGELWFGKNIEHDFSHLNNFTNP